MLKNHPDHVLFETHDNHAPDVIKDCNGEVVLGLCKKCGRAEIELTEAGVLKQVNTAEADGRLLQQATGVLQAASLASNRALAYSPGSEGEQALRDLANALRQLAQLYQHKHASFFSATTQS